MFSRRIRRTLFIGLIAALLGVSGCTVSQEGIADPPESNKQPVVDTLHGVVIEDPYRWLEDQNSPETRAWIETQNSYTESFVSRFPGMDRIRESLGRYIKVDEVASPVIRGSRYFYEKRLAGQEQYVIYMRDGLDGTDITLVDPHNMSADFTTSVEIGDVSMDGKLLAYFRRQGGQDEVAVHFLDLDSGVELADSLPTALYFGLSINADNSGFYYVLVDRTGGRVRYHEFGTDFSSDPALFGEGYGPTEFIGAVLSEDRRWLQISVYYGSSGSKTDIYVKDVRNNGPVTAVVKDINAGFYGTIGGDQMFIMTNHNAPNWCVYAAKLTSPSVDKWKLIVPEDTSAVIETFGTAGGRIFVNHLENVSSVVKIFQPDGTYLGQLPLPSMGSAGSVIGEWKGSEAFFAFESFYTPKSIYRFDLVSKESKRWQTGVGLSLGEDIEVKQVWYSSKDGTRVPMFLIHRKGISLDGNNHTYLTGYGGFNLAMTPYFKASHAVWLETGGVVAVPGLRGGNEFGEKWHRAAMFENKQNTFDDFIAAAEWLIENKYTSPEKLAIRGGSNGGLLVGAVMNQRPDLFKAVLCTYPLLDMVRYHKFLMGPYWIAEYGSADNPQQFQYIYKYSPYHNVTPAGDYPAVMFVTGDSDTRVDPLHARKMTALLQDQTGSGNLVLLVYDTKTGHSGGDPASKQIDENAVQLGFLFWQLGIEP